MIVIQLQGGLGNQMFQFAFAAIIAQMNKSELLVDLEFYDKSKKHIHCTPRDFELDIFDFVYLQALASDIKPFFKLSFLDKIKKELGLNYFKLYQEPSHSFEEKALSLIAPVYIRGYFQSYKYFIGHESEIRKLFMFSESNLDIKNLDILKSLETTTAISVHIRRGDYVENLKTQQSHGNCTIEYYLNAIDFFTSKDKNVKLLFFSDDIGWVRDNFKNVKLPKLFVDHNKNQDSWKDMLLMSSCTHNIIANSSFSWWGAWLNNNPNKIVIAPKYWYNNVESSEDLIPENWIVL